MNRRVDTTFTGFATRVEMPGRAAFIESAKRDRLRIVKYDENAAADADGHLVQMNDIVTAFFLTNQAFDCRCDRVTGSVDIMFDRASLVTIGLRSHVDYPAEGIRIP